MCHRWIKYFVEGVKKLENCILKILHKLMCSRVKLLKLSAVKLKDYKDMRVQEMREEFLI